MVVLYEAEKFHFYKEYVRTAEPCLNCNQFEVWAEATQNDKLCTACRFYCTDGVLSHGDSKTDKRVVRQLCQGFTYRASTPPLSEVK